MPERRTHDYVRIALTTLLAAFGVATGKVISALHCWQWTTSASWNCWSRTSGRRACAVQQPAAALGLQVVPAKVEGVRSRAKRLAERGRIRQVRLS
ncbi:hypothetical protein [Streptomyces avermitilis]|uniref:hypothetical protein n=1 Tax=Streptomyces avermitilis TaxID=33903 RepID=UPI0033B1B153